jgi:hypothetical protein
MVFWIEETVALDLSPDEFFVFDELQFFVLMNLCFNKKCLLATGLNIYFERVLIQVLTDMCYDHFVA